MIIVMQKIIILSLCFTSMLHAMEQQPNKILIGSVQEKHVHALTSFNREIINNFFKPLMLVEHPDNPFAQNPHLLDNFFVNLNIGFARRLEEAVSNRGNINAHIVIALDHENLDKILGFCAFTKREDCIYVNFIAVAEQVRGKGVGKALLNAALSTYNDISSCQLKTFAFGNEATRAFYERFGFTNRGLATLVEGAPNTHIMYQLDIKK